VTVYFSDDRFDHSENTCDSHICQVARFYTISILAVDYTPTSSRILSLYTKVDKHACLIPDFVDTLMIALSAVSGILCIALVSYFVPDFPLCNPYNYS
jgi:hypothetical protein